MRWRKLLAPVLAVLVVLSGCGAQAAPAPDYAPSDDMQLTIYTSHKEEVYLPIIREFEARTGIWVRVVTGGTNELLEQIARESDAPAADVIFGGSIENLESYRDYFTPYTCAGSDQIQSQYQSEDACWIPFSALPVVLIYNTKLVNASQVTCWADLLDPAFRGRIAYADPAVSGSSFTALVTQIHASGLEPGEAMARLVEAMQGRVQSSSGEALAAVADGSCLVGITLEETALKYVAAGEDIAIVYPADGTSCVPDGSALVKGAPHEENAKLFLDFSVSFDVQQMLPGSFYRRAVRRDVTAEGTLPPLDSICLIEYDVEWACQNRNGILSQWARLQEEAAS